MADAKQIADRLEKHLEQEAAKSRKAGSITYIVGLIVVLVLAGYLFFLRTQVQELAQPDEIARDISTSAERQLTLLRKDLSTTLLENPDQTIMDAVNWCLEQVTSLRIEAEQKLLDELEQAMLDAKVQFDLALDDALENDEAALRLAARDLLTEEGAQAAEDDLYEELNAMYANADVRYDIQAYAIALNGLADHLENLQADDQLSELEAAQRDLVIALKELSERNK